jgi:hypothetical protein
MNSVDKDSAGDYLVSARYTYTIYKISHHTGSIIWSLGGETPLSLSHQVSIPHTSMMRGSGKRTRNLALRLSLPNNAADELNSTADYSTALLVALNMTDMSASIVAQWDRPDGKLSRSKGQHADLTRC